MNVDHQTLARTRYHDRQFDLDAVKLMPGEYYVTHDDMVLVTVLGSCVAACIRDRHSGLGGMNHFMLAEGNRSDEPASASMRYGVYAMEVLINELLKLGASRQGLEAKVFGGARVLEAFTVTEIGAQNARFVLEFLQRERIPVAAQDLLDVWPRKVYYFPRSGRVLVKRLRRAHNDTILAREQEYGARLASKPIAGDIDLFQ